MAGLPKKYIKKYGISKRAWREYRKTHGSRKTNKSTTRKSTSRSGRATGKRTKRKISLLMAGAGISYLANAVGTNLPAKIERIQQGDIVGGLQWIGKDIVMYTTGFNPVDGSWDFVNFMRGGGTLLTAAILKKVFSRIGLGRYIGQIPVIGKWITL